jgi:hypothetical protein
MGVNDGRNTGASLRLRLPNVFEFDKWKEDIKASGEACGLADRTNKSGWSNSEGYCIMKH